MVSHDKDLQEYICEKDSWTFETYDKVEWKGIESYMGSIPNTIQTNVINMTHNWIHYGYQKDVFTTEGDAYLCLVECGRMEAQQHYINAIHHLWFKTLKCMRAINKVWQRTRTATPISRALTCVMNET